jgi:uncharacterized protein
LPDIFFGKVSSILNIYTIQYKGLKVGSHSFEFEINDKFFKEYPEGEIERGNLVANVQLLKHSTMLEFFIDITGEVEVVCDRCLEPFNLPIEFSGRLIVKIGNDEVSDNDELWVVSENEFEVNIAQYLYESVCLSLPISRYHGIEGSNENDCNPQMLNRIVTVGSIEPKTNGTTDPRWDILKNLKKKK